MINIGMKLQQSLILTSTSFSFGSMADGVAVANYLTLRSSLGLHTYELASIRLQTTYTTALGVFFSCLSFVWLVFRASFYEFTMLSCSNKHNEIPKHGVGLSQNTKDSHNLTTLSSRVKSPSVEANSVFGHIYHQLTVVSI